MGLCECLPANFWFVSHFYITRSIFFLQPKGRVEDFLTKWTDGSSRHGHLYDCLPALPFSLHNVQDEPQQGTATQTCSVRTNAQSTFCFLHKSKKKSEYFCFCMFVWTLVCDSAAGASASGSGVCGDRWLPGQLYGRKFLSFLQRRGRKLWRQIYLAQKIRK